MGKYKGGIERKMQFDLTYSANGKVFHVQYSHAYPGYLFLQYTIIQIHTINNSCTAIVQVRSTPTPISYSAPYRGFLRKASKLQAPKQQGQVAMGGYRYRDLVKGDMNDKGQRERERERERELSTRL